MNDPAQAMDIHLSIASNLVRALVARELVTVVRDGSGRRTVALQIEADEEACTTPLGEL